MDNIAILDALEHQGKDLKQIQEELKEAVKRICLKKIIQVILNYKALPLVSISIVNLCDFFIDSLLYFFPVTRPCITKKRAPYLQDIMGSITGKCNTISLNL